MKTILIPLFDGMIVRNLLHTSVLHNLVESGDVRVVLIPPKGRVQLYTDKFANGSTIFVESGEFWKHNRFEFFIGKLFINSIPTQFMRIRQIDWYLKERRYMMYGIAVSLRFLGHFRFWHRILRAVNSILPIQPYIYEIFARWQPDCVFAPTMLMRDEIDLMRLGKRRGIKTVGMIKSWDNLITKAFLRVFPDTIMVHNNLLKREAIELYGYPEDRILVTGIPQHDNFLNNKENSRESFFSKIGADPNKKLILYASPGDWLAPYDAEVLSQILDWVDEGKLGNCQVLLRLHPSYECEAEKLAGRKNLIVERPGKRLYKLAIGNEKQALRTYEFDEEEIEHLADTIRWSDVTINTVSTLSVDAAVLDKPIVLIGFDGSHKIPYRDSIRRMYDYEYYRPVVNSGGVRLVASFGELLDTLKMYLENPTIDTGGRRIIRDEQCGIIDGKAGERVAMHLLSSVK